MKLFSKVLVWFLDPLTLPEQREGAKQKLRVFFVQRRMLDKSKAGCTSKAGCISKAGCTSKALPRVA